MSESHLFDEALVLISRSIIHEINNALMGIGGRAELISGDLEKDSPLARHLKGIEEYVDRASALISQLQRCFRKDASLCENVPADIDEVVRKCIRILDRAGKGIKIDFTPGVNLRPVCADSVAALKVFLVVLIDIARLIPHGSVIKIMTANFASNGKIDTALKYRHVGALLSGVSFAESVIEGARKATEYIKGFIVEGAGLSEGVASFSLVFPAWEGLFQQGSGAGTEGSKRGKTILLVEDEDMLREVGAGMIRRLGYEVREVGSGREAVEIFELEHDRLDLVLVDLMMEGMDGIETADRIRSIDPKVPIVLSSGYRNGIEAIVMTRLGCRVLKKPFSLGDLGACLKEALGQA